MKEQQKKLITKIMNEDAKDGLYKKQTAVDWLYEQLWKTPQYETEWQKIFKQAKEIEKQQIIDAVDGFPIHARNLNGEDYYIKIFGGNK